MRLFKFKVKKKRRKKTDSFYLNVFSILRHNILFYKNVMVWQFYVWGNYLI